MHSEQNQPIQPLPCVFVLSWDLVRICIHANYISLVRDLPSSNMLEASISFFPSPIHHFVRPCLAKARISPDVAWWVDYFPSASGGLPPGSHSLWGGWVRRPAPNKGNADGAVGIFGNSGRVWATALRPVPPKKGIVPYLPVRWGRSTNTFALQARHVRARFECPGTLPSQLHPGFFQNSAQYFCVFPIKLFLLAFSKSSSGALIQ